MIPRRVWLATIIAFLFHGLFIISARYRVSYDAFTHMLFATHYAENWFSLWEARWYTGFTVVSYPPLAHQLVALLIPLLGFDVAFGVILWAVTATYPLGVYVFCRIFTGKSAASYAALASAILLPIYFSAYIFGQLPFLTSTLFALFGAASLARYLRTGSLLHFSLAISLIATTMASHHATLIVQPFLIFSALISQMRKDNWRLVTSRLVLFMIPAILAGLSVIWPFWQWGISQTMQTPIDHLSRHNFVKDPLAIVIFFLPLYGPFLTVIPFLFHQWSPRFLGLLISFALSFILGLGGTTPLPRLLFGSNWEWLTYDRFAFWASLMLTPFFGIIFVVFKRRWKDPLLTWLIPDTLQEIFFSLGVFSIFTASALFTWFVPVITPTQPRPIGMQPIVDFLNQEDHSKWRYLTFGFGNQYTYLNLLTTATTIDGSYHTAREIPELRDSGIAEIDTAYWSHLGVLAISPILEKSGMYGVRWGFVNRKGFSQELLKNNWDYRETLTNGIQVWENPEAILLPLLSPPKENRLKELSWGILPLFSFACTVSLAIWSAIRSKSRGGITAPH